MAKELAFVLINPNTIRKSRTGGVIARYIARTGLELVGARMIGPCKELAGEYAEALRNRVRGSEKTCEYMSDYVLENYSPDSQTGKVHRVMLLLFEGDDAIKKVWDATGSSTQRYASGQTVRDTYGDYVLTSEGNLRYYEPAVLAAPTKKYASETLNMWAKYTKQYGGFVSSASDVPDGDNVERTLVLIKPDNFKFASARPGSIVDILSSSGLRIIGVKKFCMTVAQAEKFYGPVKEALASKFKDIGSERLSNAISSEFGFEVPNDSLKGLCAQLSPLFAVSQFESIVKFMTGYKPSDCSNRAKNKLGSEGCLAIVYEGVNAVSTIRDILGPTDPNKASPGSVRKEFGSNIMVNAAHASDSTENAMRELEIINMAEPNVNSIITKYYGGLLSKVISAGV